MWYAVAAISALATVAVALLIVAANGWRPPSEMPSGEGLVDLPRDRDTIIKRNSEDTQGGSSHSGWTPLLVHEPQIFSWREGFGREPPNFTRGRYILRSDRTQWLATVGDAPAGSLELRATLDLSAWQGDGGLVWGLEPDADHFPQRLFRCFAVEYEAELQAPRAELCLSEYELTEFSPGDVRITGQDILQRAEGSTKDVQATLLVRVTPDQVQVWLNNVEKLRVETTDNRRSFISSPGGKLGLTGKGRHIGLSDFSSRSISTP
jgi:hypothetical protein